jgi:putative transposase
MKGKKHSDEQIATAMVQAAAGTPVEEICRKMGIGLATFYRWRKRYEGMGTNEIRRLRQLEQECQKLKQLVADLSLDKHVLQEALKGKSRA